MKVGEEEYSLFRDHECVSSIFPFLVIGILLIHCCRLLAKIRE